MHQDKLEPTEAHAVRVWESIGERNWETERKWMLTAFKTPMKILCHCFLPALLLASAISHHSVYCMSVCFQASQSGSVTLCCFSSWLLLFLLHSPSLFYLFYPTFPLCHHPTVFFTPLSLLPLFWIALMLTFPQHPCSVIAFLISSYSCHKQLLPTPVLLTGRGGVG